MTTFYRGTTERNSSDAKGSKKLTIESLRGIDFNNVIYGERSQSGAMGNAGGIILYVLLDKALTRYETNSFDDEATAIVALKAIADNEDKFDLYMGGMGNGVFINKQVVLDVDEKQGCYWLKRDSIKYRIDASVKGVFLNVSDVLTGKKKPRLDPMQMTWEESWRHKSE